MRIDEYLKRFDYPGRIVMGGAGKNGETVLLYVIMGRSRNSRNRVFSLEKDLLKTVPYDPSLVEDPSLIIYNAMRKAGDAIILTNGDQTDTIADALIEGRDLYSALASRSYEPDAPSYTPRISLVMEDEGYSLSIIRKAEDSDEALRKVYSYSRENGIAHIIHTYMGNGDPLPSFEGLPARIESGDSADELAETAWDALRQDYRVSLYVRYGEDEIVLNAMEDAE